jgi:hypothetical protein
MCFVRLVSSHRQRLVYICIRRLGMEVERELDASAMCVRLPDMLSRALDPLGCIGAWTTERELPW